MPPQTDDPVTSMTRDGERTRRFRWILLALCWLLCLELRLDALRLTALETPTVRADSAEYYFYTLNLRQYGIYSRHDSRRDGPPLSADYLRWPGLSLLALPFAGDADRLVPRFLMVQTLASAACGLIVYALAASMAGFWAGIGALLLYAIAPHLINANLYFLTESSTACLLLGFAFALWRALASSGAGWWAASGLLLGLATLTRPFLELCAPLMLSVLWLGRHPSRRIALSAMGGAFLALVLPWHLVVWINHAPGAPSLLVTTVQHGMYPDFMYAGRPETYGLPYRYDPATPRLANNLPEILSELFRRAREEPLRYAQWYLVGKPLALWQWPLVQGTREIFIYPPVRTPFDALPQFELAFALGKALHYPALLLAAGALLGAWLRRGARCVAERTGIFLRLMSVIFAWTTLLHMAGAPFPRYHMPLKPLVFVIAAAALALLVQRLRGLPPRGVT